MLQEFHLSPRGSSGVSCDADGAFVGDMPLLNRVRKDGKDIWLPRKCEDLSKQLSEKYGLPIDISAKTGGLKAIANALNDGDLARAQVAAVLLGIPDPPQLSKNLASREQTIQLIRDLHWSGMLKWNPDEHPRWPAGSTDGKGGEFAPKGEGDETGALQADAALSDNSDRYNSGRSARAQLADAGITYAFDDPVAEAARAAARIPYVDMRAPTFDAITQPNGTESVDLRSNDSGIYAEYRHRIGSVQLAGAAIPMDAVGIAEANPANWANLTRLADGAVKLESGQIITAAALLTAADIQRERVAVEAALNKFGFDPTNAADVLAARAYVWAKSFSPLNFDVPWSGPEIESASQAIMALELARPGTAYLATQGDETSTNLMRVAAQVGIENGAIFESRARPANLPASLQTTSEAARAALGLKPNDRMQAHHLVPANVWGTSPIAKLAGEGGWEPNLPTNLIELPADAATQAKLAAEGLPLPIHNASHMKYDAEAVGQIMFEMAQLRNAELTPALARAVFEKAADCMRHRIVVKREWWPRLY